MSERKYITYPTPEAIAYPDPDDPQRWARMPIARSNFEIKVAVPLRLSANNLELANVINSLLGDDLHSYGLMTDVARAHLTTWDSEQGRHMQESANIRLHWEISCKILPRNIKAILERLQSHNTSFNWGESTNVQAAFKNFVSTQEIISIYLATSKTANRALAYSMEKKPVLNEHWDRFLVQNGLHTTTDLDLSLEDK